MPDNFTVESGSEYIDVDTDNDSTQPIKKRLKQLSKEVAKINPPRATRQREGRKASQPTKVAPLTKTERGPKVTTPRSDDTFLGVPNSAVSTDHGAEGLDENTLPNLVFSMNKQLVDLIERFETWFDRMENKIEQLVEIIAEKDRRIYYLEGRCLTLSGKIAAIEANEYMDRFILSGNLDIQPTIQPEPPETPVDVTPEVGNPVIQSSSTEQITESDVENAHPLNGRPTVGLSLTERVKMKLAEITRISFDDMGITAAPLAGRALVTCPDRKIRAEIFSVFRRTKPEGYYVNDFLSKENHTLLMELKKLNKEKKLFRSVYSYGSCIFIKRNMNSPGICITDMSEIDYILGNL